MEHRDCPRLGSCRGCNHTLVLGRHYSAVVVVVAHFLVLPVVFLDHPNQYFAPAASMQLLFEEYSIAI
jgi:hypothetical protein